jgi:hypothetical protein
VPALGLHALIEEEEEEEEEELELRQQNLPETSQPH